MEQVKKRPIIKEEINFENSQTTKTLKQVLLTVLKTNHLSIFHKSADIIVTLIEWIPEEHEKHSLLYNFQKTLIKDNGIIIDGIKYYFNETFWDELHQMIMLGKTLKIKKDPDTNYDIYEEDEPENILEIKIKNTFDLIRKSKNILYKGLFNDILQFDQINIMMIKLIGDFLVATKIPKGSNIIKRTTFSHHLGISLIEFIFDNLSELDHIRNILEYYGTKSLSEKEEIDTIVKFVEIIITNKSSSKEVNLLFEKYKIVSKKLQEIVYDYFYEIIYKQFNKQKINDKALNELIKNTEKIDYTPKLKEKLIQLGDFLTSHLVMAGIFEAKTMIKAKKKEVDAESIKPKKKGVNIIEGESIKVKKKGQEIHILKPNSAIMENIVSHFTYQVPFLTKKQVTNIKDKSKANRLYENVEKTMKKMIHSNFRMTVHINPDSYIKSGKILYKKYSIYKDYLIFLLQYLSLDLTEKLDYVCLAALYEIDDLIKFHESFLNPLTTDVDVTLETIYSFLLNELRDFSHCATAHKIFEYIKLTYKYDIKALNNVYDKSLIDLIHKIFQRKLWLVALIEDAILLSLFESFIHTTFMDARGRCYLHAGATNIHTNVPAKLLVRLYDKTYHSKPTKEAFAIINEHLKFNVPKETLSKYTDENYKQENNKRMMQYIENFLKPKEMYPANILFDISKVLTEPLYDVKPYHLLWELSLIVKKPKRIFYVHSLIVYERSRLIGENPKHLINHYELDASSSGLQMLSGLFRSIPLGKMCNLISDNTTTDIYSTMTLLFNNTWNKLISFSEICSLRNTFVLTSFRKIRQHTLREDQKMILFQYYLLEWFNMEETPISEPMTYDVVVYDQQYLDDLKAYNELNPGDKTTKSKAYKALYKSLLRKIILLLPENDYFYDNLYTKNMSSLVSKFDKEIYEELIKEPGHDIFSYDIKGLMVYRMTMRLYWILNDTFKLKISDFANDRDLFKKAIMTYFYKSTPQGRKEDYRDYFHTHFPITFPPQMKLKLHEVLNFLDRFFLLALRTLPDVDLMNSLISEMDLRKPVVITNKNFTIYIEPKIQIKKQVQCPNIGGKRGIQLTIRKATNTIDVTKMRSMLGANIIHTMDAYIVHLYNELIFKINKDLKEHNINFQLIHDTNHDCFYLSSPFLLRLIIEECYLTCFSEDYLANISNIPLNVKQKLQQISTEEYMKALTPLHPLFIK